MASLLAGKVVLITGSSSGIGRATALLCARHGAKLMLHHVGNEQSRGDIRTLREELQKNESNSQLDQGIGNRFGDLAMDITDPQAGESIVNKTVSVFERVDAVVHNAGICRFIPFTDVTPQQRDLHMSVNYAGPFSITQAVVRQMQAQKSSSGGTSIDGGSIVSIASVTATTCGSSQLAHYAATKSAMLGMTVSAAVALGKQGIRVNAVSPGTIETAMNREDLGRGEKRVAMEDRVPLGRLGQPDDIAGAVVFLLSDLAKYITGQNVIVDGGASVSYQ